MDPIRKLVSGADPIRHAPAVPDGEEALRGMLSRAEGFTDRVSPDIPTLAERRQRRARIAGLLTIAAAAVTAGVLVTVNLGPLTAGPAPATTVTATGNPSPSATAEPSPTGTGTGSSTQAPVVPPQTSVKEPVESAGVLFSSEEAGATFALPTGWTAKEVPAGTPDFPASRVDVSDDAGNTVATYYHGAGGGLGGACGPEKYTATELDSAPYFAGWTPAANVRFSYRVLDQTSVGGGFSYQVGLVDETSGQLTDSCLMYSVVNGAPGGTLSFADRAAKTGGEPVFQTMAEARAYMGTAEYRKLKEMILSLELSQ
ncbi:hypothetical protein [Arthrobacter sp. B6]|uniref:hypothetical protein n=1 Tax=Arthrobacter sp. B6 TaxID=1570137 RepID=UPI00082CE26A|nr:hypothetical protein [Arthrobacter sp. B6]